MLTKLLLGAGLVLAVIFGWRWFIGVAGRPLTELDEMYPPPRDDYLDRVLSIWGVPREIAGL